MNENNVERIAKILAEDHGDPQAWGAYASKAMQIIEIAQDEWQPIETAPSDLPLILGWESILPSRHFEQVIDLARSTRGGWRHGSATVWRHIPRPPENNTAASTPPTQEG